MLTSQRPHVVLVHGLYMNRLAMKFLEKEFKDQGFETSIFTYPSVFKKAEAHARALIKFIDEIGKPCAILAHSLGGLVTRKAISIAPDLAITHVVAFGVPFKGADVARRLARMNMGLMVGKVIQDLVAVDTGAWNGHAKLGVISGTNQIGLGRILIDGSLPSDGTVYVHETLIEGYTDHILVPYSHTGMLLQKNIAKQAIAFIDTNRFRHALKV